LFFAVKHRHSLILNNWKKELYLYISGIIENQGHKLLAINGMPDHIHIFIGMRPNQSVSDLLQDIKRNSSLWINQKGLVNGKFEWQEGYGAFSYSKSHCKSVIEYIENQEIHHKKISFHEEYINFLKKFEIEYDGRYLFKDPL
jgi:putative transposase